VGSAGPGGLPILHTPAVGVDRRVVPLPSLKIPSTAPAWNCANGATPKTVLVPPVRSMKPFDIMPEGLASAQFTDISKIRDSARARR
jgi:hypothetical protein